MAGPAGASGPRVGRVKQDANGNYQIWTGKDFAPAVLDANGNWGVDQNQLQAAGLPNAAAPYDKWTDDQLKTKQANADLTATFARPAEDFQARNAKTTTGGMVFGAPFGIGEFAQNVAKRMGGFSPDLKQMDRDAVNMAIQLKAQGSRLTQMEFLKNLQAGPSLSSPYDQNRPSTQAGINANTYQQAQNAFYQAWAAKHRTLKGADVGIAWQKFAQQHFDPEGNYTSTAALNHRNAMGAGLQALGQQGAAPQMAPSGSPDDPLNIGGGGD
jgi:hypothetical protein